ncbi:uncharacterized protein PAC_09989 [Phialocephala subalpina]|uniref:Uncharacterized protein n=1 Tax=Phialocephala subalpina TaxID=576137 RepID=A0A1L7X505_9HELO|nr:uncharacterized protein PAC_09989 [Phialocephala subalpina]
MDTNDHHAGLLGLAGPYEHIDISWIEQRLKEQAGARRSRLAAYFDGVMEFVEEPPPLSRSPTPEPHDQRAWQNNYSDHLRTSLSRRRSNNKSVPRLPRRRSTSDSDDTTEIQKHRKRRQVTPVPQPKFDYNRTSRPLKQSQRSAKRSAVASKIPSAHRMETRSKSRRIGRMGISKSRSQRRKIS